MADELKPASSFYLALVIVLVLVLAFAAGYDDGIISRTQAATGAAVIEPVVDDSLSVETSPELLSESVASTSPDVDAIRQHVQTSATLLPSAPSAGADAGELLQSVVVTLTNLYDEPLDVFLAAESSADYYFPLYPAKFLPSIAGPFVPTLRDVDATVLMSQIADPFATESIAPGATFLKTIDITLPFSLSDTIPVDVVYTTLGHEVARDTIALDVPQRFAASAVHINNDDTFDVYAIISDFADSSDSRDLTLMQQFVRAIIPRQITLELHVIKDGRTEAVELFGPYSLAGKRVLAAQQFRYDERFAGVYDVEFVFREGMDVIARQSHTLDLNCADCAVRSPSLQFSLLPTVVLALALFTFVGSLLLFGHAVRLHIFLGCFVHHTRLFINDISLLPYSVALHTWHFAVRFLHHFTIAARDVHAFVRPRRVRTTVRIAPEFQKNVSVQGTEVQAIVIEKSDDSVVDYDAQIQHLDGQLGILSAADSLSTARELALFIRTHLDAGHTAQAIEESLIDAGWNREVVRAYLEHLEK